MKQMKRLLAIGAVVLLATGNLVPLAIARGGSVGSAGVGGGHGLGGSGLAGRAFGARGHAVRPAIAAGGFGHGFNRPRKNAFVKSYTIPWTFVGPQGGTIAPHRGGFAVRGFDGRAVPSSGFASGFIARRVDGVARVRDQGFVSNYTIPWTLVGPKVIFVGPQGGRLLVAPEAGRIVVGPNGAIIVGHQRGEFVN